MKLIFHGAAGTVTGSCYELVLPDLRILVDCGMFQGDVAELNRRRMPFDPSQLDYVLLTHAHIDHAGLLPMVTMGGFRGTVLCTSGTLDLSRILLPDSGHIQEVEAETRSKKGARRGVPPEKPLYREVDARKCLECFKGVDYDADIELSDSTRVRFRDAGHILGSAFLELEVVENGELTRLTFSGDLGNEGQPIIRDPDTPVSCDILLMESTYGGRSHGMLTDRRAQLAHIVNETLKRNGNLVIPSFAVGRTQDLLYELTTLEKDGMIPILPVYIDSPLATSATDIYSRHSECFDSETRTMLRNTPDFLHGKNVRFVRDANESRALNHATRSIIISSSGMCEAGRIQHHLKHNLWRPESTVLFVGYQAYGTLGRKIMSGADEVNIMGEQVAVRCRVESISQFSAHADEQGLLSWLGSAKEVETVILVHGEDDSLSAMSNSVRQQLNLDTYIPLIGSVANIHGKRMSLIGPTFQMPQDVAADNTSVATSLETLSQEALRLASSLREGSAKPEEAKRALELLQRV